MRHHHFLLLILLLSVLWQSCYKEKVIYNNGANNELELATILKINGKDAAYNVNTNSLRFSIENTTVADFSAYIEFQPYSTIYFEGMALKNGQINNLGPIEVGKEYAVSIETRGHVENLRLSFTTLPIVQIITPNSIKDTPKTMAKIKVNHAKAITEKDEYIIGIEFRGGSSQLFDKKSFGFSLKGSTNLDNNITSSFFDMRPNNDWILDAMWIDEARLRNKTSFELWKKMNENSGIGISAKMVELYINNEAQGIYSLNENINAEFLNIEGTEAVLYKATNWENGATRFETYANDPPIKSYWDGWDQKYPDPTVEVKWSPLNNLRSLVVNGTDEAFKAEIASLIDLDNLVDYYIFLNLLSAADNTGKNIFLFKESSQAKFKTIPWDLDGAWGLFWNGELAPANLILSNNLFNRLINLNVEDFKGKLKTRWNDLHGNLFSQIALENLFESNFAIIEKSGAMETERTHWSVNIDVLEEKAYIFSWIGSRLIFLDTYFDDL